MIRHIKVLGKYCFGNLYMVGGSLSLYDPLEYNLAIHSSKVEDLCTLQASDFDSCGCVKRDMQEDVHCCIVCNDKSLEAT